jgi:alkylation response protein AidB-like acyl-CoA dehydrogenase
MPLLFNPATYDPTFLDEETRTALKDLVAFFEAKGNDQMQAEYFAGTWYDDFLDFCAQRGLLAMMGTPSSVGGLLGGQEGAAKARWDTARINEFNEILGFYSLAHWYAWQVTVLGLGPVWISSNEEAKAQVGKLLESGALFGFGLSEQTHGADIYSTDMILTRDGDGWTATGGKYYIGNGNVAGRLSVFGKFADDDPEHPGEYVFFLVDTKHPQYLLRKNVVHSQMFVAAFDLDAYPVSGADILHVGKPAWDAALATVNVGKVNLGWASIGIAEHAFYEAVTHANNRILYGKRVTDFPHVRRMLGDAYARLIAMKAYSSRSADYFRSASEDDRRFLLFNPITKAKVTSEGERVINLLWDVIAAKGFERDTYFSQAAAMIRALPKLEGTVHVNIALVLKFLPNYIGSVWGNPAGFAPVPVRQDAADDGYLFEQGPASGLSKIKFNDPRPTFERFEHLPNVKLFVDQAAALWDLVMNAPPTQQQQGDLDYLQVLGQLFSQVVYAQLIMENAELALDGEPRAGSVSDLSDLTEAHLDRIFAVFIQDMNEQAIALHGQSSASEQQRQLVMQLVKAPVFDAAAEDAFVAEALSYDGAYVLQP